ncbi:MAG: hypothetical protein IPF79_04635 [Ignavibacteria bacterium]|nr:hypothetical protein [Ignavibacteria bacterium]
MNSLRVMSLLACLAVLCSSASAFSSNRDLVRWAQKHVGHTERGGANRSSLIDEWNRSAGAPVGSSWCGSFATAGMRAVGVISPSYRGAMARGFLTGTVRGVNRFPASWLFSGIIPSLPIGTLVIWRRGDGWQGHIDITVATWYGRRGKTVGGNTSSGNGDLREGDGVWERWRTIDPTAYQRITDFVLVDTTLTVRYQ